jgi:tetratricopeptide (TPR) repeat protein
MLFVMTAPLSASAKEELRPDMPRYSSPSEIFLAAQTAYDDSRYEEAAALYAQLISNGVDNVELHYNLANAHFKSGNLPEAVLQYRRAWYQAPRDPDIRANLHFALNAAGAVEPSPGFIPKMLSTLSLSEWMAAAAGGYLLLMVLLLLSLMLRRARRLLLKCCLLPFAIILLAVGGWRYWSGMNADPEWVIVRSGATTLFGPIEGATAHFKVPLAALVRQSSDAKGWVEIEYDGNEGWIREAYIKRVYP